MFRLTLFGTPQLEGSAGVVPQPGPRRLALLASLAVAGPAGLTRDKIVARLWPEADEDRARRNLSQVLYSMRTELGVDLVDGTGTVRLDPAQCSSDVGDFDLAIAEHRDADALAHCSGAFLDGFHLTDNGEFAAWAEREREERAATARAAAIRLADAVSASDTATAATAWKRAHAFDPLNSRVALSLIEALNADGERTAAIRIAEQYAVRVRDELDADPDPVVMRRAEELRRSPATQTGSKGSSLVSSTVGADRVAPAASAAQAGADDSVPLRSSTPWSQSESEGLSGIPNGRWTGWRPVAVGAVLVLVAITAVVLSRRPPAALRADEFVLLAEFANHTSDSLLTTTVGTAVAAALQQSAFVVPLPRSRVAAALRRMQRPDTTERLAVEDARDVAQREGVRLVLGGDVIESGSEREIISRIIEARTGRILSTRRFRVSSDDELLSAIDRLAAAMRTDLGEAASSVSEAIALPDVTTGSLPALRNYAQGLDAERRDYDGLASEFFLRAVSLDSNFASAHAQLGTYFSFNNDIPRATYHFTRALQQVDRLPLDEAQRIQIAAAYSRGDLDAAVRISRSYLALRPRDAGAWARLAFYLYNSGRSSEARAAYATADSLSPLSAGSVMNIGNSWFSEARRAGDPARFDSALVSYERAFAMQPSLEYSAFYNHQYGTILLGVGRPDSARATFTRMTQRDLLDRARGLRSRAFLDAMEGRWSEAVRGFSQAAEVSVASRQWTSAIRNDALLADLLLTLGDRDAAAAPLTRSTTVSLREPLEPRAVAFVALAQVKAGNISAADRLLRRMRASARPEHSAEQAAILTVEGALHLAAGRAREARTALEAAFARDSSALQTRMLRARALAAVGDDGMAADAWKQIATAFDFGIEGQFDWQLAEYERGRVLERMNSLELAIQSYRRAVSGYLPGEGEREPPALVDARARLRRLEQGGR